MSEHEEKYEAIAQQLGISNLLPLVKSIVGNVNPKEMAKHDPYLKLIALRRWDEKHWDVFELVRNCPQLKGKGWSLADSVCVLKHVAKFHYTPEQQNER